MKAAIFWVLYSFLIFSQTLFSQWTQTNGPNGYGGIVNSIVHENNKLFAAIPTHGVYLSLDGGFSWKQTNTGLTDLNLNVMVNDGSRLYAGTQTGVWISTNEGVVWYHANGSGLTDTVITSLLAFNDTILAGTTLGIYISTNNGSLWTPTASISSVFHSIKSVTNTSGGRYIYAASNYGLFLSTNSGYSWGLCPQIGPCLTVGALGTYIFCGAQAGIYLSTDFGFHWAVNPVLRVQGICFTTDGLNVYAGGGEGVYVSSDFGSTWDTLLVNIPVLSMVKSNNDIYAACSGDGVFKSSDNGATWNTSSNGLLTIADTKLVALGDTVFAGTSGAGISYTINNGADWIQIRSGIEYQFVNDLAESGNNFCMLTPYGICVSSNRGSNWIFTGWHGDAVTVKDNYFFDGTGPFGNSDKPGGIYVSSDYGASWQLSTQTSNLNIFTVFGNNVYAGFWGSVAYTSNYGASWFGLGAGGLPTDFVTAILIKGSNSFAGMRSSGVYRVSDPNSQWVQVNNGLNNLTIKCLAMYQNSIFAGTADGVFRSTNDGDEWTSMSSGMPANTTITSLAVSSGNLFAATVDKKVLKYSLSGPTEIHNQNSSIPDKFSLDQNYPNPFNPATKIKFGIPAKGNNINVNLVLYDILGREVGVLVNKQLKPGNYEYEWDGSNYPSGVYFYKLTAGDFTEVRKMILLK